ncbi:wiskott-Aldrich syndrome protein family member 1-like isoform X2 [Rhinatrema bivittatum]|uniref:wiskott-Aldrich syndrome protein family member 1-like isoform X2 n=1 Tax=Rhinatrema bivittatum TaxID=194408 RepID=UPI00112610FF|nr:wiskott-Aldrich syndrome protein family member 1-like isoform X2 [Rhinatrema bivittatum]
MVQEAVLQALRGFQSPPAQTPMLTSDLVPTMLAPLLESLDILIGALPSVPIPSGPAAPPKPSIPLSAPIPIPLSSDEEELSPMPEPITGPLGLLPPQQPLKTPILLVPPPSSVPPPPVSVPPSFSSVPPPDPAGFEPLPPSEGPQGGGDPPYDPWGNDSSDSQDSEELLSEPSPPEEHRRSPPEDLTFANFIKEMSETISFKLQMEEDARHKMLEVLQFVDVPKEVMAVPVHEVILDLLHRTWEHPGTVQPVNKKTDATYLVQSAPGFQKSQLPHHSVVVESAQKKAKRSRPHFSAPPGKEQKVLGCLRPKSVPGIYAYGTYSSLPAMHDSILEESLEASPGLLRDPVGRVSEGTLYDPPKRA